jgi:hypothetical protein
MAWCEPPAGLRGRLFQVHIEACTFNVSEACRLTAPMLGIDHSIFVDINISRA